MRLRLILTLAIYCLISSLSTYAQSQILPDHFGPWKASKHSPLVMWPRSEAASRIDAHPDQTQVYLEAGLVRIEEHYYEKDASELAVRVFKLRDPSGAYQVYTTQLRPGMNSSDFGQLSASSTDGNVILVGNLVVTSSKDAPLEDLAELVKILKSQADGTPLPPIPSYLATTGRISGTERYALGPVGFREAAKQLGQVAAAGLADQAGFNSGAEAMFARYKAGRDEATLLLIEYPTPQLAELHLKHMQRAISAAKNGASVERKGSLLSIVLAPSSQEYAEKLRAAVNYETQVTWSEPSTTATDPPIMSTLVKIFVATGVFMVVTVVVGIAFGGVRIITKRLFPGKVFDRPEQMEVLQLGLTGKPIDPRDLY